jgi:peroxiredoxin
MRSHAPRISSRPAGSKPGYKVAGFVIVFVWTCIPAALFSQRDVHAALIPPANRKPAPAFQLVTESGTKVGISDYRGKVVLLDFWATDCGGCVLEIPSYIELEKVYGDKGFAALGVSMDISYEGLKDADEAWGRVKPFMAKNGVNYTIAMGDDAVTKAYTVNTLPATYLIDKSGRIAVAYVGVLIDKDNVATNIKSLLSEQ